MATRADKSFLFAILRPFTIAAGQSVTVGKTVIFGANDDEIQDAGAGSDLAFGVVSPAMKNYADANGVITAASLPPKTQIEVVLFGNIIVPMKVGTGATTRGKKQVVVADGITDAAANGGGTTDVESVGISLQSGVLGDMVGVMLLPNSRVSA